MIYFISNKHPLLLLSEGLAGSLATSYIPQRQQRRVSPTMRPVWPKSWSSPSLAQRHSRKAGVSWEENKIEIEGVQHPSLNLPSMGLQLLLGMDSGRVNRVDTTKRVPIWGQNSSLVPARVWVTLRMKSQEIIVHIKCNKVHQFIFCSQ